MRIRSLIIACICFVLLASSVNAEKMRIMYSSDGRVLKVAQSEVELYKKLGWYEHLYDVIVYMYDANGKKCRVYADSAPKKLKDGYRYAPSASTQLMFADDGRVIYVPRVQVESYMSVGWYRGGGKLDPSRPMVAITYDDGPAKYTDSILDKLEKYGVRATFFVQGKNVPRYASSVKRAVDMGCEIGNHTNDHANLTKISASDVTSEISAANNAVYNAAGVYPKLFRPPYGAYNNSVLSAANMPAIMWSVDTLDWKTRNADKTLESVKTSVKDGSIILMHDIHEPTADAAERVIKYLLKQGYQLVTVSELLEARKGGAKAGTVYSAAYK